MALTRALGIDYGKARIGLALSDPMQILASPLCVIENKSLNKTVAEICEIIKQYNVTVVAVGVALYMDGTDSELSQISRKFGNEIAKTGVPVKFVDERFTTKIAERALQESFMSGSRRQSGGRQEAYKQWTGRRGAGRQSACKNRKKATNSVDKISASIILQTYLDINQTGGKTNNEG